MRPPPDDECPSACAPRAAHAVRWLHRKEAGGLSRGDRSLEGQIDTIRDKDGALVGTRHRHDNRLAMGILTRLDRKAEAYKEDERLVMVLAEEFEELLDVIEADGGAEDFIDSHRPEPFD